MWVCSSGQGRRVARKGGTDTFDQGAEFGDFRKRQITLLAVRLLNGQAVAGDGQIGRCRSEGFLLHRPGAT